MKRTSTRSAQRFCPSGRRAANWLALVIVAVATGVSLGGCALRQPPPHATIVDQALPKATPLPPTWKSSSQTTDVTNDWVKSFHDPGLEAVVSEAIANNLDLRAAAARVEAAQQVVVVVGSKLKPQVNVIIGGATTHSENSTSGQEFQSNMEYGTVSWELDVWGRLRSQRAAAQQSYEAVAQDYAYARQSLAATTAKAWYLAIQTRQLVALGQESVRIYTQLFELVKVRRAAGKVADLDVAEASYQLNEAQNALLAMQGLYSEAQRTLEVLVGRYPSAELEVANEFAMLPPPVAPGLPSTLLERRPDIAAAEHQVLSAFRTQEAAKLALLPSFSLNLEGGRLSDRLLSILNLNPWLFHGSVGMFVPIYSGGALQAQIKIATAEEQQAVAHFGGVALKAFGEVEVALTNGGLYAERIPHMVNAVNDHTEAVRVATIRYTAGNMDFLSVLQLQQGQIESQAALIEMQNAQLANRINLHLALGGSFDSAPATALPATAAKKP